MLAADRVAVGIHAGRSKSALEPSPGDLFSVQQIPDRLAAKRYEVRALQARVGEHAFVAQRADVADERAAQLSVCDVAGWSRGFSVDLERLHGGACGGAGDQIDGA